MWEVFVGGICEGYIVEGICGRYLWWAYMRDICGRYMWEVFVGGIFERYIAEGICGRYLWCTYVRGICGGHMREVFVVCLCGVFVEGICETYIWAVFVEGIWAVFVESICGRYLWKVYVGDICRRHMWEVFVEGICWRHFYSTLYKKLNNCKSTLWKKNSHKFELSSANSQQQSTHLPIPYTYSHSHRSAMIHRQPSITSLMQISRVAMQIYQGHHLCRETAFSKETIIQKKTLTYTRHELAAVFFCFLCPSVLF